MQDFGVYSIVQNRTHIDDTCADDDTRDRKVDYGYDDLYRLTRETITEKNSANDFVVSRRIEYTYDRVGNRETMTVTHDDLNTSGACVTESVTVSGQKGLEALQT
ncbi:MAG: hypothetical protein DHS20C16_24310 [Phycisphaerae bacterium]|nr:MAG: hypothetical protein DHS20C16_24310 [Phycisphaerae bacterium]